MIPRHWKRSAADNGSADPNLDVRPNRPASTVLGAIRGLMASGAASRDDVTGGLVATLGGSTTNVYSVSSNEGLIDIATGINGIPAAITAPFLLRLSFDTVLAGSSTNVPHLKVDSFDCGPILRRNGAALADGDLVAGTPVVVLGDMAASTDTKVTRVRVLDLVPSDMPKVDTAAIYQQIENRCVAYTNNCVQGMRWVEAGSIGCLAGPGQGHFTSPFGPQAMVCDYWTWAFTTADGQYGAAPFGLNYRNLQMYIPNQGWVTVGAAS